MKTLVTTRASSCRREPRRAAAGSGTIESPAGPLPGPRLHDRTRSAIAEGRRPLRTISPARPIMDQVIGVDIGTQSTKAVLVARDGTILAQASRAYAPDTPAPQLGRAARRRVARRRRGLRREGGPRCVPRRRQGDLRLVALRRLRHPRRRGHAPAPPLPDLDGPPGRSAGRVGQGEPRRRPPRPRHRQRRRQLPRLHQDDVAARRTPRRLETHGAVPAAQRLRDPPPDRRGRGSTIPRPATSAASTTSRPAPGRARPSTSSASRPA